MTHQEILERAIQKAVTGGWTLTGFTDEGKMHFADDGVVVDWLRGGRDFKSVNDIIFSHDFAKAVFGESIYKPTGPGIGDFEYRRGWKEHLQQMVIADDPIEYLGENI